MKALLTNLKDALNQEIPEDQQSEFIEFLLKYIELAMSFLSIFTITQYALQMKYSSRLLDFLPVSRTFFLQIQWLTCFFREH